MKKIITYLSIAALSVLSFSACQKDDLNPDSVIKVETAPATELDKWLNDNYVKPYNIDFKYRFELNESDMNYYTVPADYDEAVIMAHLVKYLCIDTYDEVASVDFTREYFPKMFFLIGEFEYRNNETFILGTAEGGKKVLLSGVNYLSAMLKQGPEALNHYYIKTIHHEFTHILNQIKDYPTDFKQVTGSGYVADNWSKPPYNKEYLKNGFISDYAQHSDGEDFAEMLSIYVTNTQEYWDSQLKDAGSSADFIRAKLQIVRDYMKSVWSIDIDELRSVIIRRQDDVMQGKVDLSDLTVK